MLVLVVAFVYSWVLTLVILGIVPLMMLAGLLQLKALAGHATNSKKALEGAGKVAVDSIENIRTVAALGIEDSFFNQYKGLVRKPYKYVSGEWRYVDRPPSQASPSICNLQYTLLGGSLGTRVSGE